MCSLISYAQFLLFFRFVYHMKGVRDTLKNFSASPLPHFICDIQFMSSYGREFFDCKYALSELRVAGVKK